MIVDRLEFVNREALAISLARKLAHVLSRAISLRGQAVLAVSGGTTPVLLFEHLSRQAISWEKVIVTLVDERQVPETHERSNARLVRAHLLRGNAKFALFVPLFENPEAENLADFDAVVLGMGLDGHTASFFPGGDTLAEAIDPSTEQSVIAISAPSSGEPRLTFTLPKLVRASYLALHIEGQEKLGVLADAETPGDVLALPIRAILNAKASLHVYWCP